MIGITFKETKIGPIPDDWELLPFDDFIGKKGSKVKYQKLQTKDYLNEGQYPIVDQGQEFIAGYTNDENNVYTGSLPVTIFGDHTLIVKFVNMEFAIGADGTVPLYPNKNKLTDKFFYYLISNHKIKSEGYQRHIKYLKQKRFAIPPLPEQRKIAEILSTVDETIGKTDTIIQETQQLKKGLMQKLFSQGIGHTQFKETAIGRIPKVWEVVRLASITKRFLNGGTPNTNIDKYWNGDIPWITGTDIIETVIVPSRRFITHEGLVNSSSNLVPKGSILVVTRTGVGKIALAGCDMAISQDLTGVILNEKRAHNNFYLWYLKWYSPKYVALAQGTTIGGILRKDVERTLVPIPFIEEQKRIAEILSEVDAKIETEEAYKSELEQLKKGLMQVLLTGKVRVKV